jgi:hypothetical protein
MDPGDSCQEQPGWVFGVPPARLPAPPARTTDYGRWAKENGGIPQSGSYLTLDVQALQGHSIFVHGLGIKVTAHGPAPHGTAAVLSSGCGGVSPAFYDVNLDHSAVIAKPVGGTDQAGRAVPAVPFPHQIAAGGAEEWSLRILTTTCTCSYDATIDWGADNGVHGQLVVLNDGKAWRVAATTHSPRAISNGGKWQTF